MRRSSLAAPHPSGEALRTVVTACACGVRSPEPPGPTPAPHLGPNERACPRAAVSTSPLGRPRKTRCGEHTWPLSEGAASELGAVSLDCALVCALFSWGSHPGGTQARGDLAASLPRQRSGLGQAAPPPRGDFRGHFRGLPGGGGWGQFCACVTLRKPTRFRHSPSRDPPPLALPVCTSTRGRADGLGGPRGPPLPLAGGAGGGGGKEWLRGWGEDTAVFRDAGWLSGSQGPGPPAPRRAGTPGPPISP